MTSVLLVGATGTLGGRIAVPARGAEQVVGAVNALRTVYVKRR